MNRRAPPGAGLVCPQPTRSRLPTKLGSGPSKGSLEPSLAGSPATDHQLPGIGAARAVGRRADGHRPIEPADPSIPEAGGAGLQRPQGSAREALAAGLPP